MINSISDLPGMKIHENGLRAPIQNGHMLKFNGMAVAPELGSIKEHVDKILHAYQESIPGSEAASNFLLTLSSECRKLLRQMLFGATPQDGYSVEFYSGTSRAMEVAIARLRRPAQVILSPFEHPTAIEVSRWYTSVSGTRMHQIQFTPEEYSYGWREQEDSFIEGLRHALASATGHSVLILSEVCYATGMVIPVAQIIERIRQQCGASKLSIIIDGAHSMGNGHDPHILDECESYIFSAHKWLLAPEPCGIILSRRTGNDELIPYDAWSLTLPCTTANARTIAGLFASLRLLDKIGFESLWAHSRELQRRFLERMNSKLEFIGENTGMKTSLMMAIRPKEGKRWKFEIGELHSYLQGNSVHVLILSIEPGTPWIRIAFHCFSETEHLDMLCSVLEGAIDG
jgi:selenocysteine lyase/cysteine desulfurase